MGLSSERTPGSEAAGEWVQATGPRSAASVALGRYAADGPIPHRAGSRAELGHLRARVRQASEQGDADTESAAVTALARALAARGSEWEVATKLARRSLLLREDPRLREELSGWFAGLGEPALAAATLRPLLTDREGEVAASVAMRIGVLLGRAGDASGAAAVLAQAGEENPRDPVPLELLGSLGNWAGKAVPADRAADALLQAASCREAIGERSAAFEDLLRAAELAPDSAVAVERLCAALASRGRVGAADEVRRQQARARGTRGREVHMRRMQDLAAADDTARALGAGFDARVDADLDLESALRAAEGGDRPEASVITFDELLTRAGLFELLAARLELLAESSDADDRKRCLLALARLCSGPLGSPDRAADAWIDALTLEPTCEAAKAALREHATGTHDAAPLVEALIRVGASDDEDHRVGRAACLRELVVLAEQRLTNPGLALWAVERLSAMGVEDPELSEARRRLEPRVQGQDEELELLAAALEQVEGPERARLLRRQATILAGRPGSTTEYQAALLALIEVFPEERAWRAALERLCWRTGRVEKLANLLRRTVAERKHQSEGVRSAAMLASLRRRRDDPRAALAELQPVLGETGAAAPAWSMALVLSAQLGDDIGRARALLSLASGLPPRLRAVLGSVAAELRLGSGDLAGARAAAEQASHADPSLARPLAVLAQIALSDPGRRAAAPIERAMSVVVPRASTCEALAQAYQAADDLILAAAWTQRWLALRPGDPRAAIAMLGRVTAAGDAGRLADALAWLLAQPQPLGPLSEAIAAALIQLAHLDSPRGVAMARRTLDLAGPRLAPLRDAVLQVADVAGERGLAIAVVERWLASGAAGDDRPKLLMELVRRRKAAGDADGAARAVARAVSEGADPNEVLRELDVALPARSSDGELSLLEARAEALSALTGSDLLGSARAWREYGAACWDLAEDHDAAIRAWDRSATLDAEQGIERLGLDLLEFGGIDEALTRLRKVANRRTEPNEKARALAVAANLALHTGRNDAAFDVAGEALALDPTQSDLLALAERAAGPERIADLVRLYDAVAEAALGSYGERAARYRAARQLERRGALVDALRFSLAAFEAVPAAGVTFVMAARLADRTQRTADFVGAVERAAAGSRDPEERAVWLERAAKFAGSTEEAKRERVNVLLRALQLRPDVDTLHAVGEAVRELVMLHPEDSEIVEVRFKRAVSEALARMSGPDGALAAIEAASVAVSTLDSAALAAAALERAVRSSSELAEYERLWDLAPRLANAPEEARAVVALIQELSSSPLTAISPTLVELGVRLAREFDDARAEALLLVDAARKTPDDETLARRAAQAAEASGDADLLARVVDLVPTAQRTDSLLAVAVAAEQANNPDAEIEALEQVLGIEDVAEPARIRAVSRLRELYAATGRRAALEQLLAGEIEGGKPTPGERVEMLCELAKLARAGGDTDRALRLLGSAARERRDDERLYEQLAAVARYAEARETLVEALERLLELATEASARVPFLRELAAVAEQHGDLAVASQRWTELLEVVPDDGAALLALQQDAERRADYDALVGLLERRIAAATDPASLRSLRLKRADVLEQSLGRRDEARAELQALVSTAENDAEALTRLADLHQRLGDEARAAPLWMRASEHTSDRGEASKLARQACEAYLRGGDVAAARRGLEKLLQSGEDEAVLRLQVEVERGSENPLGLAAALSRLARYHKRDPSRRAELLLEAMRASNAGGDTDNALAHAREAARAKPDAAAPQLSARLLEYLERGAGSREEARVTVAELRGISEQLTADQEEVRAFLIAEALEVAVSGAAALRELERVHDQLGPRPLVSVGLAERLARGDTPGASLAHFDTALAGDLRGVRERGEVAMLAAETAYAADQPKRALELLEIAATHGGSHADALALTAMIRNEVRAAEVAASAPPPPAALSAKSVARDVALQTPATLISREPMPTEAKSERPPDTLRFPALVPSLIDEGWTTPDAEAAPTALAAIEPATEDSAKTSEDRSAEAFEPPPAPKRTPPTLVSTPARVSVSRPVVPLSTVTLAQPEVPDVGEAPRQEASAGTKLSEPPEQGLAEQVRDLLQAGAVPDGAAGADPDAAALQVEELPEADLEMLSPGDPSRIHRQSAGEAAAAGKSTPGPPADDDSSGPISSGPPSSDSDSIHPADAGHPTFPPATRDEASLLDALARGSVQAGHELMELLEGVSGREHDLLAVCRRLAVLMPGDREVLRRLYSAALRDHNLVYAAAVDHVMNAFAGGGPAAPPLAEQPEDPESVHGLLFRDLRGITTRALSLVWRGAGRMFQLDPSAYGVTGLERVPPSAPTAVARTYSVAARALGLSRTPLFHRATHQQEVAISLAMLSPPAVILSGEVLGESPELAYGLAGALVGSLPDYALLAGAEEEEVRRLLQALAFAFGTTERRHSQLAAVARLAEVLWEGLPARAQREMQHLCEDASGLDYAAALIMARRAARRAGLFVCGDLAVAVRATSAELGISGQLLDGPDGLAAACSSSPDISDLVRLATSPQYAVARWQSPRAGRWSPSGAWGSR